MELLAFGPALPGFPARDQTLGDSSGACGIGLLDPGTKAQGTKELATADGGGLCGGGVVEVVEGARGIEALPSLLSHRLGELQDFQYLPRHPPLRQRPKGTWVGEAKNELSRGGFEVGYLRHFHA